MDQSHTCRLSLFRTVSADSPALSSSAQQGLVFGRRTAGLAVAGVAAGMMVVLGEL